MGVVATGTGHLFPLLPGILNAVGGMGLCPDIPRNDVPPAPLFIMTAHTEKPSGLHQIRRVLRSMGIVTYVAFTRNKGRMKILLVFPISLLLWVAGKTKCCIRFLNGVFGLSIRVVTTQATPDR